jgi:ketosteroid isomerase-like protein
MRTARDLVHAFFAGVTAGELPDSLLTDDARVWITTAGNIDKATYQGMIRRLARICARPLVFTIDSITEQDDRVIAEAHSESTLIDGQDYGNTYVLVFRVRNGRIASIAEHYNALIVQEKILPLLARPREQT